METSPRLRALFCCAVMLALCAFDAAPALTYNPQHYVNNDPQWDRFNETSITSDRKRGEYIATFPATIKAQDNKPFTISGFILPLEASAQSRHFVVVRRNTGCPFCPPNAPTEALEVMSLAPVKYTGEEISVTGTLELISSSADGLFFKLRDARVIG